MIGIVILSFNDAAHAVNCVNSIFRHTVSGITLAIVNNGCDKKNTKLLKRINGPGHYIEISENVGVPRGYNIGIKELIADGCDYIILLNADTQVSTYDWHNNMKRVFEKHPDAGMVGAMSNYIAAKEQDIKNFKDYRLPYKHIKAPWLGLGLTMIPTKVFKDVGMFDEKMGYGGCVDLEFSIRLRKAGYKLYADGYTMIWHRPGSVGFSNLKIPYKELQKRNSDYIRKKYPEESKWVPLL